MNNKYHIEILKNKNDIESALNQSLQSFYPNSISADAKKLWVNKWFNESYLDLSNVYVNKIENQIIGGLRTVYRTIYRKEQKFNVLGIAETFVNPAYQKKGIAGSLTQKVLAEYNNGNADLALIIARKKIDHFYLKYQGFGLGSYSKAIIKINGKTLKKYNISQLNKQNNLEILERIYAHSYKNCFGRVERDANYWEYLIDSAKYHNIKFYNLIDENDLVGYFALFGNEIIEIGAMPDTDYRQILVDIYNQYINEFNNQSISLNIPNNHKLFTFDLQFDVTINNRECYYGGQIVKILNINRVSLMVEERLKNEYLELNISSFEFKVDELNIEWNWNRVTITYPENHEPSYNETAFLLGSQLVYGESNYISNIDRLPFSINRLDEF